MNFIAGDMAEGRFRGPDASLPIALAESRNGVELGFRPEDCRVVAPDSPDCLVGTHLFDRADRRSCAGDLPHLRARRRDTSRRVHRGQGREDLRSRDRRAGGDPGAGGADLSLRWGIGRAPAGRLATVRPGPREKWAAADRRGEPRGADRRRTWGLPQPGRGTVAGPIRYTTPGRAGSCVWDKACRRGRPEARPVF